MKRHEIFEWFNIIKKYWDLSEIFSSYTKKNLNMDILLDDVGMRCVNFVPFANRKMLNMMSYSFCYVSKV